MSRRASSRRPRKPARAARRERRAPEPPVLDRLPEARPIARALHATRGRIRRTAAAAGAGHLVAATIGLLVALLALDWFADLPRLTRAALLAAAFATLARILWVRLIRPATARWSDDAVALRIEKANPDLRSRLISSVQLARATPDALAPGTLVGALLRDTLPLLTPSTLSATVDPAPAARSLRIAGMLCVAALLAGLLTLPTSTVLLRRLVLLSDTAIPRRTQILEITGNTLVARGDDLPLTVRAGGSIPGKGRLVLRLANGRRQELPLEPDPADPARFARTVARVQDPFTYSVRIGDAAAGPFTVTTLPRPAVTGVTFEQEFPAYTGLPRTRRLPGDLHLLAGSRLHLSASATVPLSAASARLAGLDTEVPLAIDPADPSRISGSIAIPPTGLTGLTLQLTDQNGLASTGGAFHPIDILPDHPPAIRITRPERREELVTPGGTAVLAFEAGDDFGIARAWLLHKRSGADAKPVEVEFDLGGAPIPQLLRRFDWRVAQLDPPPAEGEII